MGRDQPFDSPYSLYGAEHLDTAEHRQLAKEAALQSITLLRNGGTASGAPLLPFKPSAKLFIGGPNANSSAALLSNYHGSNNIVNQNTPLLSLQRRGVVASSAQGVTIAGNDTSGIAAAAKAAKAAADGAVLFLGLDDTQEAETRDRHDLKLPGEQLALAKAVVAAQPRTAIVLICAGAVDVTTLLSLSPTVSLLWAGYGGELAGEAIADILLGVASPSGRLSASIYSDALTTRRNISNMDLRSQGGITYQYTTAGDITIPFGFGLSYSSFSFRSLTAHATTTAAHMAAQHGAMAEATAAAAHYKTAFEPDLPTYLVNVTNTGSVTSDVSVLGFVAATSSVRGAADDAPLRELFDFERLAALAPGESRVVQLAVPPAVLSLTDATGVESVRAGDYLLEFGVRAPRLSPAVPLADDASCGAGPGRCRGPASRGDTARRRRGAGAVRAPATMKGHLPQNPRT